MQYSEKINAVFREKQWANMRDILICKWIDKKLSSQYKDVIASKLDTLNMLLGRYQGQKRLLLRSIK